jgi:hypothetical protein
MPWEAYEFVVTIVYINFLIYNFNFHILVPSIILTTVVDQRGGFVPIISG